jgi:Uncharacterized protein conserved in bacteria
MLKRTIARAAATLVAAAALALAAPLAASAHVHVDPDQAAAGSESVLLTFRVPTESANAGTVRLEVDFPTDHPFTSITYQPMSGWSVAVTTTKLPKPVTIGGTTVTEAPTKVVWTADKGVSVAPGQFQQFVVSAGPVPNTGRVMLPAHQTYSDGTVVNWDQPTPASGVEPEHPAPTLYIDDAPPSSDAPASVTATTAPSTTNGLATASVVLGVAGLALGAIALVIAVLALARRPRLESRR